MKLKWVQPILAIVISVALTSCDGGGGERGGGSVQEPRPRLTEAQAIDQAKAYIAQVSQPKTEKKQVERRKRVRCGQVDIDLGKCQKGVDGFYYKYKTELKWETVQVAPPCKFPQRGGTWTAQYNSASKTWLVVNDLSATGKSSWTVDDRTGKVTSHQPPC